MIRAGVSNIEQAIWIAAVVSLVNTLFTLIGQIITLLHYYIIALLHYYITSRDPACLAAVNIY